MQHNINELLVLQRSISLIRHITQTGRSMIAWFPNWYREEKHGWLSSASYNRSISSIWKLYVCFNKYVGDVESLPKPMQVGPVLNKSVATWKNIQTTKRAQEEFNKNNADKKKKKKNEKSSCLCVCGVFEGEQAAIRAPPRDRGQKMRLAIAGTYQRRSKHVLWVCFPQLVIF